MGDARDRGLDAAARDATNIRPLGEEAPSLSEARAAASLDASIARARVPAEAGAGDGDASAALTTLLAQLNRAYPNRNVGRQDGIQAEGNRFALAITADTEEHVGARLPSLAALAARLAKDPRFEKSETQKPSFWNSIDKVYLRIFTREGAPSEDSSPWNLGAGGESGAPLDLVMAVDDEALVRSLGRRQRDLATAARAAGQGAAELVRTVGVTLAQLRAAARVSLPPGFDLSAVDDDALALVLTGEQKRAVREARDAGMSPAEIVQAAGITVAQLRAATRPATEARGAIDLSAVDDDALALVLTGEQKRAAREARDAGMSPAEIVQAAGITVAQLRAATRPATEARGAIDPFRRFSAGETGSTQLDQAGNEAKKGLAIGGTVGTALEAVPPPFGQLLHGAAMVLGAIGGFFAGLGRDTFHPNALQALAWLTIFQIAPGMLFSGVDTITTKSGNREHPAEDLAARLVRVLLAHQRDRQERARGPLQPHRHPLHQPRHVQHHPEVSAHQPQGDQADLGDVREARQRGAGDPLQGGGAGRDEAPPQDARSERVDGLVADEGEPAVHPARGEGRPTHGGRIASGREAHEAPPG